MARIAFDTRLVQTAVIGSKNSEQPIILPMEPDDLEAHRRRHPNYTYYCGTLLGGCGGELADRLYRDGRVCHFAHHPDQTGTHPVCHRTANGEDSADHLFIKQGVTRWLNKQKIRGETKLRDLGRGPGDAIDIHLPDIRHRIRFHLTPGLDVRTWRQADEVLTEDSDTVDWILTHDSPITRELLNRDGYCLRVRCETDGAERRVHIGAQHSGHPINWTRLEDCTLTPAGLVTPAVESIRLTRPKPEPAGFLLKDEPVFTLANSMNATHDALPSSFTPDGRHVILADVKPAESRVVRAFVALPNDVPAPTVGSVYRLTGSIRLFVTDPDNTAGPQWALSGDKFIRLNGDEAQRTGLWTPPPTAVNPSPPQPEPQRETVRKEPQRPLPATARAPGRPAQGPALTSLRAALERVAQLRSSTTWEALIGMADLDAAHLGHSVRRDLLVAVDEPVSDARPLLSVLVRERNGEQLSYMGTILKMHDLNISGGDDALRRWCTREAERAYAAYSNPPRSVPPRLGGEGERDHPTPPSKAQPKGVLEESLARLAVRIEEARQILDQTTNPERHQQLAKAIQHAQGGLNSYRRALQAGTAHMKWLSGKGKSPRDYDLGLHGAMKGAQRPSKKKRRRKR
ncbi:hypothetical protein [Streptomyces chartreusis]|uniref:hypothetical protein n=1 Tax=Streptomyces chartreusis TaxID=1969 RepID=UPI0036631CAB